MNYTLVKTSELPRDVQAVIKMYDYNGRQVKVIPCIDFACPTNWHDYNIMKLVVYNQENGQHKSQASGFYDSYVNFTKEELAMYHGKLKSQIPGPHIWFMLIETYPKSCRVYCHPDAITKTIAPNKVELTRRQEICLYITRSLIATARVEEAHRFKFTTREYLACKAELIELKLINNAGALTIAGKNRAQGLEFNYWTENKQI